MNRNVPLRSTTDLKRTSPLERGSSLRMTGIAPAAERAVPEGRSAARGNGSSSGKLTPPAPAEFSPKVKLAVRKRAGRGDEFDAACESCGRWLGRYAGEYQHRDARGMGGCKDAVTNGCANCVLLCRECHMLAESRDRDMLGMGFWLENGQDPRTEPIMLHGKGGGGATLWLAQDGIGHKGTGYLYQAPEVQAA